MVRMRGLWHAPFERHERICMSRTPLCSVASPVHREDSANLVREYVFQAHSREMCVVGVGLAARLIQEVSVQD